MPFMSKRRATDDCENELVMHLLAHREIAAT
jgi:hypothetical protein